MRPVKLGASVFDFKRPYIMGILNLTPDSFFDGGRYSDPDHALKRIELMVQEGADIIDIGAQSTRPGAEAITIDEEWSRLAPVLKVYKKRFSVPLSLDTFRADIAEKGLALGVDLINDISAFNGDSTMPKIIAEYKAAVCVMHMQGTPQTMQQAPKYKNVVKEVYAYLENASANAKKDHIETILIDPGIGFGKSLEHNCTLIQNLAEFRPLKKPIVIGISRKSMIGLITGDPASERLEGSLAAAVIAYIKGAHIIRAHDIAATKKVLQVAHAITSKGGQA